MPDNDVVFDAPEAPLRKPHPEGLFDVQVARHFHHTRGCSEIQLPGADRGIVLQDTAFREKVGNNGHVTLSGGVAIHFFSGATPTHDVYADVLIGSNTTASADQDERQATNKAKARVPMPASMMYSWSSNNAPALARDRVSTHWTQEKEIGRATMRGDRRNKNVTARCCNVPGT